MQEIPLLNHINCPPVINQTEAEKQFETTLQTIKSSHKIELASFYSILWNTSKGKQFLSNLFLSSPYLSRLITLYPETGQQFFVEGPDKSLEKLKDEIETIGMNQTNVIPALRIAKNKMALITAMADISGIWTLENITRNLSVFAENAVQIALKTVLYEAYNSGTIRFTDNTLEIENCGIIILGMGKLGAYELNYSSDIDLILLYDPEKIMYTGRRSIQHIMTRVAQDLVSLLQERTSDGYVFRTDLRLRPDPASTPPAIAINSALSYYESVGQNWERAAMIKARLIAGDTELSQHFFNNIQPFIWRKHLDFAAIEDILSIKRQMHGKKEGEITVEGHNIKTGRGGIREIEFLGQVHQLIWGGRHPELRMRGTLATLKQLTHIEKVTPQAYTDMEDAYHFLRTVEHRLQMIDDQQTHSLPENEEDFAILSAFTGISDTVSFKEQLSRHLENVHKHFLGAFSKASPLGGHGKLVFTGVDHDKRTLETLEKMEFSAPETVSEKIQKWHKGNIPATRSTRSREILTELMPHLLEALSSTANPQIAFERFDRFMQKLPFGVQIFALFQSNPNLLQLVANIMGSAPALGQSLTQNPNLLNAVLLGDFYGPLPNIDELHQELGDALALAQTTEEEMEILHIFRNEKQFQAGVQLLNRLIDPEEAGHFLSDLAEIILEFNYHFTRKAYEEEYGCIPDGSFTILALGKLGEKELTFGSDLDLMFVYQVPNESYTSDGERPLQAVVYYNRLAQRITGNLMARTTMGRLYEVDVRLRPFGKDGPIAVSLESFDKYYTESAWVFEKLALTRCRAVVTSDPEVAETVIDHLRHHLMQPIPPETLREGLFDIRDKIATTHPPHNCWDIKYARGGLMDVNFIVQYLALKHAKTLEEAIPGNIYDLLVALNRHKIISQKDYDFLTQAHHLLTCTFFYIRLCVEGELDEERIPLSIQKVLSDMSKTKDFASLRESILQTQIEVYKYFQELS